MRGPVLGLLAAAVVGVLTPSAADGRVTLPVREPDPAEELLLICWKDKYGFIDRSGRIVVQPIYDEVHAYDSSGGCGEVTRRGYSEGLRPVQVGREWGYINANEKFVIAPRYERVGPFRSGSAQFRHEEKWGLIDRAGRTIVEPRYSYIGPFRDGIARVAVGGSHVEEGWPGSKWGLIDEAGNVVLEPKYDMVRDFDGGVAFVNAGGRWAGGSGLAFVGGRWGAVDRTGKFLSQPSFELPLKEELDGRQLDPALRKLPGRLALRRWPGPGSDRREVGLHRQDRANGRSAPV